MAVCSIQSNLTYQYRTQILSECSYICLEETTITDCFEYDTQYSGTLMSIKKDHTSTQQCQISCVQTAGCVLFEYYASFAACFLMSSVTTKSSLIGKFVVKLKTVLQYQTNWQLIIFITSIFLY